MLKRFDYLEIRRLFRLGHSIRAISRVTGRDRQSIRNVLSSKSEPGVTLNRASRSRGRPSTLLPFGAYVAARVSCGPVCGSDLLAALRLQGYSGSRCALYRFLRARGIKLGRQVDHNRDWMLKVLQGAVDLHRMNLEMGRNLSGNDLPVLLNCVLTDGLKQRNRALAVLAHAKGISSCEIGRFLRLGRKAVAEYINAYRQGGVRQLLDRSRKDVKKVNDPKCIDAVFRVLHAPPGTHGFNRTSWRMDDLKTALAAGGTPIGTASIREIIWNAGYRFRKARKVLTSTDPDYRQKLARITHILENLKPEQKFFSIDEFGPVAVKMRGGTALMKAGEVRTIPQRQRSKGIRPWTIARRP